MKKKIFMLSLMSFFFGQIMAQDLVPMHNAKGKFGYGIKGSKKFTIKAQWDEARPFNEKGVAIVRTGTMFGMINKSGKPIGEKMGYSVIQPYDGTDYWIVALGGKRVENAAKIKTRIGISPYGFKGSTSYPIDGAKWGLVRKDGTSQITPKYQEMSDIMPGNMIVVRLKDKYGYIDVNGAERIAPQFDVVTPFNKQGLSAARVKKSGYWVLMNSDGKTLIDEKHKVNAYMQFLNNKWGSGNGLGADSLLAHRELWNDPQRILPLMNYASTWINSEFPYVAAIKVKKKRKSRESDIAIYNIDGECLVPFQTGISEAYAPSENIMFCVKDSKTGFYDIDAKTFAPVPDRVHLPIKDGCSMSYNFQNGLSSDFYLVDKTGNKKSDSYDDVELANGRYIVKKGSSYGVISTTGEQVVPLEYALVVNGGENLFAVKSLNGKCGYYNTEGKIAIPLTYDDCSAFVKGYAVVSQKKGASNDTLQGIIDRNNKAIIPISYKRAFGNVEENGELNIWVSNSDVYSKCDIKSGKLLKTEYADMKNVPFGIMTRDKDGWYGLLQNSTEVIPCVVEDDASLAKLYEYMLTNNITNLNRLDAHSIASKLNPARNTYKLKSIVEEKIWDF